MNIEALKLKFPAEYSAVFAAGREAGISAERDRVAGHLRAAKLSGADDLAHAAIADGRDVASLSNEYLEAGLCRREIRLRQEDSDEAGAAVDGAVTITSGGTTGRDKGDEIADAMGIK